MRERAVQNTKSIPEIGPISNKMIKKQTRVNGK